MSASLSPYAALRALLIDGVSGRSMPAASSCQAVESARAVPGFWHRLIEEAEYHGVTPFIEPLLAAYAALNPDAVPQDTLRALGALVHRQRTASRTRERVIDSLLATFADRRIDVLLLKGSALGHMIYERPELRSMVDVDLMIRPKQADAAVNALRALGFTFASGYDSRFAGSRLHHLPVAQVEVGGFVISVELHVRALSPDFRQEIAFETLRAPLQQVPRGEGPAGVTLGHGDMLRHIGHHAFEPAARVRLKHLLDLWLYREAFEREIDWQRMRQDFPEVLVMLSIAGMAFAPPDDPEAARFGDEIGAGMLPPSEILASRMSLAGKLAAVFNPPSWWLHGRYGVPPDRSLLACQMFCHPANMARWLARRLLGYLDRRDPLRRT